MGVFLLCSLAVLMPIGCAQASVPDGASVIYVANRSSATVLNLERGRWVARDLLKSASLFSRIAIVGNDQNGGPLFGHENSRIGGESKTEVYRVSASGVQHFFEFDDDGGLAQDASFYYNTSNRGRVLEQRDRRSGKVVRSVPLPHVGLHLDGRNNGGVFVSYGKEIVAFDERLRNVWQLRVPGQSRRIVEAARVKLIAVSDEPQSNTDFPSVNRILEVRAGDEARELYREARGSIGPMAVSKNGNLFIGTGDCGGGGSIRKLDDKGNVLYSVDGLHDLPGDFSISRDTIYVAMDSCNEAKSNYISVRSASDLREVQRIYDGAVSVNSIRALAK